jgi:hypothetical protein
MMHVGLNYLGIRSSVLAWCHGLKASTTSMRDPSNASSVVVTPSNCRQSSAGSTIGEATSGRPSTGSPSSTSTSCNVVVISPMRRNQNIDQSLKA